MEVIFTAGDDQTRGSLYMQKGSTVGELLDAIKTADHGVWTCVWLDGVVLPLDHALENWYNFDAIFQVMNGNETPYVVDPLREGNNSQKLSPELELTRSVTNLSMSMSMSMSMRPSDGNVEFLVVTNTSTRSLQIGDILTFRMTATVDDVSQTVRTLIESWGEIGLPNDVRLHVFLPGGLPFVRGTLADYDKASMFCLNRMYVCVTRPMNCDLTEVVPVLCDCSSDDAKMLLSPLYDASDDGYIQMACLLGYMQNNGDATEHMLMILAKITRFAPLLCAMYKLLENVQVTRLDVIAITSLLHVVIKGFCGDEIANEDVLSYTLRMSSLICDVSDITLFTMRALDWENKAVRSLDKYCRDFGQPLKHAVVWDVDFDADENNEFGCLDICVLKRAVYEDVFDGDARFKPVSPFVTLYLFSPAMMNGTNNTMLFVGESPDERDSIKYIDPVVGGNVVTTSVDVLQRSTRNDKYDDTKYTEQVLYILMDKSYSMKYNIGGSRARPGEQVRMSLAKECLRTFLTRTHAYRVRSAFGLMSFGADVEDLSPISPIRSDFISAMDMITPLGVTKLWDCIDKACDKIIAYHCSDDGDKRILVISDGDDQGSAAKMVDIANKVLQNSIIVDAILIAATKNEGDALFTLSELSGGLVFEVASLEKGLELFRQEAFLDNKVRVRGLPFRGELTQPVLDAAIEGQKEKKRDVYTIQNVSVIAAHTSFDLSSALYVISKSAEDVIPCKRRMVRIIRELKDIVNVSDPNIVVWLNSANWGKWRVFIKGPDGTVYADKWWSLYVTFPRHYPTRPPVIRFVSVPLHPNISNDGLAVFRKNGCEYCVDNKVGTILQEVIELMRHPDMLSVVNEDVTDWKGPDFEMRARESVACGMDSVDEYEYMKNVRRFTSDDTGFEVGASSNGFGFLGYSRRFRP